MKVKFIGDAVWFLGQWYNWHTDPNNRLGSCHISQQVMIEGMLERHQLEHCTIARSPCRFGISIDRIDHDCVNPQLKEKTSERISIVNWWIELAQY